MELEINMQCSCKKKEEFRGIIFCVNCGLEFNEITIDNNSFHVLGRPDKKKVKNIVRTAMDGAISTYINDECLSKMCLELYNRYRQGKSNSGRINRALLYACKKHIYEVVGRTFNEEEEVKKFSINKSKMGSKILKIYSTIQGW